MLVSQQTQKIAINLIKQGQNCDLQVYQDSAPEKNLTIGWGHKLQKGENWKKITQQQADQLLKKDVEIAIKRAINVYGEKQFNKLSPERQAVLIDMSFNMGQVKFPNMMKSLKEGKFNEAAYEVLNSKYFQDTKSRCLRNAYILKDGKIYTKEQAIDKGLNDKIIQKSAKNKVIYLKDQKIKNILNNQNPLKNDADIAKQVDKIKDTLIGGVSFDIDPVSTRLNGFISQDNNIKMVEGSIYDESNYTFMDLVTPLKIMYDPEIKSKNISVSLDPLVPTQPDGPWYSKTFYPIELKNTDYGAAMIEADYLMKRLSLGVDENNQPYPYPKRVKQMGLDVNDIFKSVHLKSYDGNRTRLWIVIKDYEVGLNEKFIEIKNIKMGVELKALQLSQSGSLRDCNFQPSPIASRFCQIFTRNYDQLCQIYPILARMKRLAKASIIAKLMYFRRVQVDINLINKLHQKQKQKYQQTIPRLQNKLRKQLSDKIIQMQVLGGCSFDIHNMQTKINDVQNQIKQLRKLYEQKKGIGNASYIPLKINEGDKSEGKFVFVKDEKNQISDSNVYPFLFHPLVQCRICKKTCNSDYYSITNKQCVEHSTMKCQICRRLIVPGQPYKSNADKSMIFHDNCLRCSKCHNKIDGPFANMEGSLYHPDCIPKKSVGTCQQCKKQIFQGQPHAQNPQTMAIYHGQCAKIVNQRIQDAIPSCKHCNVKLSGQFVRYQDNPYHEQCAKKMLGLN